VLNFGWKRKALTLKVTLLSAGHQIAKELPIGIQKVLDLYRRVHETKDPTGIAEEIERIHKDHPPEPQLREPAAIGGWDIDAMLYRKEGNLWWLFHAQRKSAAAPSSGNIAMLYKVLEELGADPKRHVIIGPESGPGPDYDALPFGWWTWRNTDALMEIQVDKNKTGPDMMRIVPAGSRATDGYEKVDLARERLDEIDAEAK
jgi:hypothetical protein